MGGSTKKHLRPATSTFLCASSCDGVRDATSDRESDRRPEKRAHPHQTKYRTEVQAQTRPSRPSDRQPATTSQGKTRINLASAVNYQTVLLVLAFLFFLFLAPLFLSLGNRFFRVGGETVF